MSASLLNPIPVAQQGTTSSTPLWFSNINWGSLLQNATGNLVGGITSGLFGESAVGQQIGNAVGNLGSQVSSTIAEGLITNLNIGLNLKDINFSLMGYGLTGGLLGTAIGGNAGQATSAAFSSIPTITKSIKGIKEINKLKDLGTLTKAGKWALASNIGGLAGTAASIASSFMPEKTEYSGLEGKTTAGLDTAYSAIQAGINFIPGVGLAISGGMAVADLLGKGFNALGAGTDGMTTLDAVLGSSFFNWNLGALNGAFGKRSETFNKNQEDWDQVGSAYQDSENNADYALARSNKKYGVISNRARKRANRAIRRANLEQGRISLIANEDLLRDAIHNTMSPYYLYNVQNLLNGGLDFYSQYAKFGAKLQRAKNTLKKSELNTEEHSLSETWEASSWEPTKLKDGGNIKYNLLDWVPNEWDSDILEWKPLEWYTSIEEFKEGGKMNVIPEGALHARLHHMDLEGITKKGIPVITEEDGKVIQHAEIELNEIVFTLEVTLKIEELMKDGSDKAAIEAGKLLATEIIDNTDDRTNLIEQIQ